MNANDYTYLLNKPNAVNDKHSLLLDKIVDDFPYFQSARALRLKNLYNQDSFKYNYSLKVTAAHTTDRSVLFDFITSKHFSTVQKALFEEKIANINNIIVNESEVVLTKKAEEPPISKLEQSILTTIKEATSGEIPETKQPVIPIDDAIIEEKLAIGKPLNFAKEEKHSFQEWLQLSSFKPIEREKPAIKSIHTSILEEEKNKKLAIIDRFIEANPKISPIKSDTVISVVSEQTNVDNSLLMTETLAKVYLEQKKYSKAIQAYEILILKYPEKFSFFANRISDIKILQQNNN